MSSFGLFKTIVDTFGPPVQTMATAAAQILQKPGYDFGRFSPELGDAVKRIFIHDSAQRSHRAEFTSMLARMKQLGFMDDTGQAWKHGYSILDTVPVDVLLKTNPDKWNGKMLGFQTRQWIRGQKASGNAMELAKKFDMRYLDEARVDDMRLNEAINSLSPLQRQALHQFAGQMHSTRNVAIASRFHAIDREEELSQIIARKTGKIYTPLTDEQKFAKMQKDLGPTVSSYIPHFVYDAFADDTMTPELWKLAGDAGDLSDFGKTLGDILHIMPDEDVLKKAGSSQPKWLAGYLHEALFKNSDSVAPEQLESTAIRLLRHRGRTNALVSDGNALIPEFDMDVYVKFYHRRLDEMVTSGVYNPFSRMDSYVNPVLRKIYMEPAVTEARVAGAWMEDADPAAYARFNNWLNGLTGSRANSGIEYLMSKSPTINQFMNKSAAFSTGLVYAKLLWANTSSALLNLTQPLQFGLGKHGALAGSAAATMLLNRDEFGDVLDALARSSLVENSLGAVLGGRTYTSAADSFLSYLQGDHKHNLSLIGRMLEDVKMSTNRAEATRMVLPFYNRKEGFSPGAIAETLGIAGSFMSMAELAVRQFTTVAGAYKSALDQLMEELGPEAKILLRNGKTRIVGPDGREFDVLDELKRAAPKEGVNTGVFGKFNSDGIVSWDRIRLDSAGLNADVNFVLSSANYSELERYVRKFPVFGPVAATFTNYTMHVASRLATDVTTLVRAGASKSGLATRIPVNDKAAAEAMRRLTRYAAGTFLIGGPYAFSPMIATALNIAHTVDPTIPQSIDEPEVKAVLDVIEKFSLTGAPTAFGLPGIDYSGRVGPQVPWSFITGGRFSDTPLAEWLTDGYKGFLAGKSVDPEDRIKSRYNVLGSFAKFFDPTQEYGNNPFGRSNPFVPVMVHNMAQMAIDLHAAQNGLPIKDEAGKMLEIPPPMSEIIARGVAGRTVYTREKMRRIAQVRPALAAEIRTLRRQFVDAWVSKDYVSMREVNKKMHDLNPVEGETDNLVHPDLTFDNGDLSAWKLRHMQPAEVRQMLQNRSVMRTDERRAYGWLRNKGYLKENGTIDYDKIENSSDPNAQAQLTILETALHRRQD